MWRCRFFSALTLALLVPHSQAADQGVEFFDTATGVVLGSDTYPAGFSGRGTVAEDELDGSIDRYAYVLATDSQGASGHVRVVDLQTGLFVANNAGETAFGSILGQPIDIEIKPASAGSTNVIAYVTSVRLDTGDCPAGAAPMSAPMTGADVPITPCPPDGCEGGEPGSGGGGGSVPGGHRRTLLTVIDMDRTSSASTTFETPVNRQEFELGCAPSSGSFPLNEIGLAWNAARDRLFVVSPDMDSVISIGCCNSQGPVRGLLDDNSSSGQLWEVFPVRPRPTDVVVAGFDFGGGLVETVVVSTLGIGTNPLPALTFFEASVDPTDPIFDPNNPQVPVIEFESDSVPISITAHPTAGINGVVIVADRGRQEIRTVNIAPFPFQPPFTLRTVPTSSIPKRVTVQGRIGKKQP